MFDIRCQLFFFRKTGRPDISTNTTCPGDLRVCHLGDLWSPKPLALRPSAEAIRGHFEATTSKLISHRQAFFDIFSTLPIHWFFWEKWGKPEGNQPEKTERYIFLEASCPHPVCHRCQGASVWTRPKGDGFLGETGFLSEILGPKPWRVLGVGDTLSICMWDLSSKFIYRSTCKFTNMTYVTARCLNACEKFQNRWQVCPMECQILWLQHQVHTACVHWNRSRDPFNFWLHTIPSFLHWPRTSCRRYLGPSAFSDNLCSTRLARSRQNPEDLCDRQGCCTSCRFFSYVLFGKVPLISALYMRCSQAFLQQPHILSYSFRDKLATFWTHMAKWSSSVKSFCSAGRSNRAFRAQTLSPSRHFEPLTERHLKWFGGDFGIQIIYPFKKAEASERSNRNYLDLGI